MPPASLLPLTGHLRRWATERGPQRAFTFIDFPTPDSPGRHRSLTWNGLDRRSRAIGHQVAAEAGAGPGDRAALLLPQGLDYVAAFLGCLAQGVIAVPLFPPDLPGHAGRLAAVLRDCEPSCVLTDAATAPAAAEFAAAHGLVPVPVLDVGRADPAGPEPESPRPSPGLGDVAYLQYTSGSTRVPAGVMISHGNVAANARQALTAIHGTDGCTTAGWLPLFHDMGLVLSIAAPLVGGLPSVLMDPVSFLERPVRWLRMLAAYPGAISAAPNFAYEYCAARVGEDEAAGLRLDGVRSLINGSEPVRPGTVERFRRAFAATGLPAGAQCPSYGLAEATVFVTADPPSAPPRTVACDPDALAGGEVRPVPAGGARAVTLVECGLPVGQDLRVTDPETGHALPEDRVGEIRLRGPNVGLGYWKRTDRSEQTFAGRIPGEEGDWLHTGDLGALHAGRLLVTGRLKDLLIVDGRNHYPQDLEETIEAAADCVRRGRLAVFTVEEGSDGDGGGRTLVVAVAEHRRDAGDSDGAGAGPGTGPGQEERAGAERAARAAVSARHGVRLARLVLVPPGAVPRTSSGKISRSACRERFLSGAFTPREAADE